jgi:DNA-binding NarL/FixJ family response regulator
VPIRPSSRTWHDLTPRQRHLIEVLIGLGGADNRQIARYLGLQVRTVRTMFAQIYRRLGFDGGQGHARTQLVVWAWPYVGEEVRQGRLGPRPPRRL